MVAITLPYNWEPRDYQLECFKALDEGCMRYVKVWHRRAGKDLTDFNWTIRETQRRVGVYWHMFPTYSQGKKAIWEGVTADGRKYMDFIPKELIKGIPNKQELKIEFTNGSVWRIVGAEDVDTLVGSGPVGIVFSEFPLIKESVWHYIEPMLAENGGWALFNGTPRGEDHFFDMIERNKSNPNWVIDVKTINDTNIVTRDQITEIRTNGTPEATIQQEYYCSFESSSIGAYYDGQMRQALNDHRICSVPYNGNFLVHTAWDLGMDDATAIWFYQVVGKEVHLIDYYEESDSGLEGAVSCLMSKSYNYGTHYTPWDGNVREWGSGITRIHMAAKLGIKFTTVQRGSVAAGVDIVRGTLSRCYFDAVKCKMGIESLKHHQKKWNEERKKYDDSAAKTWAIHGADAFRYLCTSIKEKGEGQAPRNFKFKIGGQNNFRR